MPTYYLYDPAGHLLSIDVVDPAKLVGFSIDALGRHASQTIGSGPSTTYAYLGTSSQISSSVVSGALSTYSAIDAIGDRLTSGTSGGFAYLGVDLHGNVVAAMASGSTPSYLSAYRYDAYGETCDKYPLGNDPIAVPWRFQGRILESASGATDLYDFGARSYDPSLGTFTSFDSVSGSAQNPLTLNRYLYALANPATLIDPTGHNSIADNAEADGCANGWIPADYCEAHDHPTPHSTSVQIVSGIKKKHKADAQALLDAYDCISHPENCANEPTTADLYRPHEHVAVHVYIAPDGNVIMFDDDGNPIDAGSIHVADNNCFDGDAFSCELSRAWGYQQRVDQARSGALHASLQAAGMLTAATGQEYAAAGFFGVDAGLYVSEGDPASAGLSALGVLPAVGALARDAREWVSAGEMESHSVVQSTLDAVSRMDWGDIYEEGGLSKGQMGLLNTNLQQAVQGTAMHNALAATLESKFPSRFIYNSNYGPDLFDTVTHTHIEVSTAAQAGFKASKYAGSLDPIVVTYEWDPITWEH